MVEYLKTKKGYFYKLLKNGEKKRISQQEYINKIINKKLKYKMKGGGNPRKLDIYFGKTYDQTIGDCIKELIDASHSIYNNLLIKGIPTTIVCGGQSPSYYCLAMMNFSIFNSELVNIVILPHSKGGEKTKNQMAENVKYCERLKEKNIILNNNVVIIDGVHSGTGILALESALKHCFPYIQVYKIAINTYKGVSRIKVNEEIILRCEPKFSDIFPRLVTSFRPDFFNNSSKFITNFIDLDTNPVAEMIIDIAKDYHKIKVEDTEWYKLNNEITEEILAKRKIFEEEQKRLKEQQQRLEEEEQKRFEEEQKRLEEEEQKKIEEQKGIYFKPIILTNPKRYQCPECKSISGISAPLNPNDLSLFSHNYNCKNKYRIPKEKLTIKDAKRIINKNRLYRNKNSPYFEKEYNGMNTIKFIQPKW